VDNLKEGCLFGFVNEAIDAMHGQVAAFRARKLDEHDCIY
jgi:hypothetical protein